MIYGFYFRFYKYLHIKWLSVILAYLVRFAYFIRFLCKRIKIKRKVITIDVESALKTLRNASSDPMGRPTYEMADFDDSIDLSVIVPVYNHKAMSIQCINSLLNQDTAYNYELILVDDGSSDGIELYLDEINEKYETIKLIRQINSGIAAARNTGIAHAHGKYIMFVDCDDIVDNTLIDSLMKTAYREQADIVMCAHELIKVKNGKEVSRVPNIYPEMNLLGYKNGDEIMNYAGLPWCKVYRRNLWEKVRFFPGYWYEDNIIHTLIFTQCKVFRYISEVHYSYFWHETNFSHIQNSKKQNKAIDEYWELLAIMQRAKEIELPINDVQYTVLLKHLSAYYYTMIKSLSDEIVESMFVVARDLLLQYKLENPVKLPYMLKQTEKAILNNDIELWKLCSMNQ